MPGRWLRNPLAFTRHAHSHPHVHPHPPLSPHPHPAPRPSQARHAKALALLLQGAHPARHGPPYDEQQALLLCAQHRFEPGLEALFEAAEQPAALLRHLASRRRLQPVMRACRRSGEQTPAMWVQALGFLASLSAAEVATEAAEAGGGAGGEAGGEGARGVGASGDGDGAGGGGGGGVAGFRAAVVEAVEAVEREGLLQPPLLLQLLSPSDLISLDLVRDYLTRQLQREARLTQAPPPP